MKEVLGADFTAVNEAYDEAVDLVTELLDQVGGEGEVAWLESVEQVDLGEQAGGPQGCRGVDIGQGIAEREQGIDGVGGRAALAAEEGPVAGEAEELVLNAIKEGAACGALEAEQGIERGGDGNRGGKLLDLGGVRALFLRGENGRGFRPGGRVWRRRRRGRS